jgi:hypothetical protein
LAQTLAALDKTIETDRENGRIPPQKGRGNASIAIDIYLGAPGTPSAGARWRERVNKRLRISRRWADVGGSLPLLLVTYSDQAERIMYVSWISVVHTKVSKPEIFGRERDTQSSCNGGIVGISF